MLVTATLGHLFLPLGTVKSRIARARRRLAEILADETA
jgi:DNA-directed RNA polymerase specialized sigma24 family protein